MNEGAPGPASPVGSLPLVPAVWVDGGDTACDVAGRMTTEQVAVVLVDPADPGILTEHDLVRALCSPDGGATPARELATPDPLAAFDHEPVLDAARRMLVHRIRHLVVIREDRSVLGILALGQVTEALVAGVLPTAWAVTMQSTTTVHLVSRSSEEE